MLFNQILKFFKLHIIAIWLDMLRKCLVTVFLMAFGQVLCADYIREATQRGLDYGESEGGTKSGKTSRKERLKLVNTRILSNKISLLHKFFNIYRSTF